MRIIYSNHIPFRGYKAMNLFGMLIVRNDMRYKMNFKDYNHEDIHTAQYKELGFILFLPWYLSELFYNLFVYRFNFHKAYKNVSFEKEAYHYQYDTEYLESRKPFAWYGFIKNKKKKSPTISDY